MARDLPTLPSAPSAERSPERIRADIERTRAELTRSVQSLRVELHRSVDWREWVRKNPGPFLVGAFTLGFILGASSGGRGRRR